MNSKAVNICHFISNNLRSKNIDIWLEYGSALGAIRDGGITDGDDDIDIALWEKDWKTLEKLISKPAPYPCQFKFIGCYSGGYYLHIKEEEGDEPFKIDIWSFNTNDNHGWGPTIRSGASNYKRAFRGKAYYQQNLRTIQFEGLEFLVSKYAEKYFDYLYKDTGGFGTDWRTTVVKSDDVSNWEGGLKSYSYRDPITGCAEGVFDLYHKGHVRLFRKMKDIFDKVVAVVVPDEVVLSYKKTAPIIPFDDRVELLESCKYVDRVIQGNRTEHPSSALNHTRDNYEEHFPQHKDFLTYLKARPTIEWMETNSIDYMVQGRGIEKKHLNLWYEEPLKEKRLVLLNETKDYHTEDIRERIKNASV